MWREAGERPLPPEQVGEASPGHTLPPSLTLQDKEQGGPYWNPPLISLAVLITDSYFLSLPYSELP